jgi:lactonase family protein with 7-bladed beta-propeller
VTAGGASPADGKRLGVQMSKKIVGVVALAGLCALSLFLLNCGTTSSRPSGLLYALTQGYNGEGATGIGYNVSSFAMDFNNGNLSLINSNASTCPAASSTNPFPCGLPLDILLDPTGTAAFVLNQGVPCLQQGTVCVSSSNNPVAPSIYPYTVNSDGSLSNPGTAVTWTANAYPDTAVAMVRDAAGQFLFVIDQGSYPSPGYPTPSPTNPSCPHAPTSQTDVCPSISVFAIQGTTLTLASGSPFYLSKIPTSLSPITFTPPGGAAQELLFVTNNFDICTSGCVLPPPSDNTVSVYSVSSSGTLSEQPNSPYIVAAADPISVIAVNTNPAVQGENTGALFVYVGNQDANGGHLYPFQVCTVVNNTDCTQADVNNNLMVPVATCSQPSCNVAPSGVGQSPVEMLVDPTNSFLYVVSEGSNQVFAFRISPSVGTLTALSPANQPTGSAPVSMAMHPTVYVDGNYTGQFLYVSNSGSNNITGFTLSTTSGAMSNPISVIAPAGPSGIAAH